MGSWLSEREMRLVAGAEKASAATPIPTQIVSNGEYLPPKQSETQKRVERRILELADENAKKLEAMGHALEASAMETMGDTMVVQPRRE